MTDVFVAGPVDFQAFEDLAAYRTRLADGLRERGLTPVDQYSDALALLPEDPQALDHDDASAIASELLSIATEPYLRAFEHAVRETSVEAVLAEPELVPRHTPADVLEDIVERDLELVSTCDAVLAYLPEPSCGTTVEMLHATRRGIPVVVQSERPPLFVRYVADCVHSDLDEALDAVSELTDHDGSDRPTARPERPRSDGDAGHGGETR